MSRYIIFSFGQHVNEVDQNKIIRNIERISGVVSVRPERESRYERFWVFVEDHSAESIAKEISGYGDAVRNMICEKTSYAIR